VTPHEILLNEFTLVSFSEIVAASGLSAEELNELIELGLCEPCGTEGTQPLFAANAIELARAARRLQIDFELPLAGVALVLAYRERIRELKERLRLLEWQLSGRARD
jgi:MerR HTH family regulatory protein